MTDRFHVDAYVGSVHDRADALANDAYVAFQRLIASGSTTVSTDPEERGAVPTIRHASRPDLYAQVSVDRYRIDALRTAVMIGVVPTSGDQLRTAVRIIVENPGPLCPDDASEEDVARTVLETAAVHMGRAIQRHLDAVPDADRSDGHTGPENRYALNADEAIVAAAVRDASIATLGADDASATKVVLPTPWAPMLAHSGGKPVEIDRNLAAQVRSVLSLETVFAFSDGEGRGTSGTFQIRPLTMDATVVGPMERLRAMNDARNAAAT